MTSVAKLVESPSCRAKRMIDEINALNKDSYERVAVVNILKNIIGAGDLWNGLRRVESIHRGDVFVAKVTGGKTRPWVCLSCRDSIATAVAISSGDHAPRMVKSQARYWPGHWLGTTVSMFRENDVREFVSLPYNNRDHLREIERQIAQSMGLRA